MTATATRETKGAAPAAPPKKSKKKLVLLLVALLGVGAGAYLMLKPAAPPGPPVGGDVVALDPITVNLAGGHYLKVAVAVQLVQGKGTAEEFKTSEAAELVIDEFANRTVAAVSTTAARTGLAEDLEKKITKAYDGEVFTIFLTQFVTQ